MTCTHARTDRTCSGFQKRVDQARQLLAEVDGTSMDSTTYEIVEVQRVGAHLVMKVKYASCVACAYEGSKVMVFLNVSEADALRWRRIDPHFRDPSAAAHGRHEAPSPAARFPASPSGWTDALAYATGKV
jgi:hypothetical protein